MTGPGSMSLGLAFLAGLVSFLSPCVLPIVPSYITFITGLTVDELGARGSASARRRAALHATLFVLGFSLVFIALGATATVLGATLRRWLPLLQRIGGVALIVFGLTMIGVLRVGALMRERRLQLASKPAGVLGSLLVGVAFGAGWTPCVGPILASILLYAGMDAAPGRGTALLAMYALGLGIPFWIAAVGFNWYLAGARRLSRWLRPIEVASGVLLVLVGLLLVSNRFVLVSNFFASFGQLVNLEP
jgi:cytochrome c-type biogenesis protein